MDATTWLTRNRGLLYHWVAAILTAPEDVADGVQEAALRLTRYWERLSSATTSEQHRINWARVVTVNAARDVRRRRVRHARHEQPLPEAPEAAAYFLDAHAAHAANPFGRVEEQAWAKIEAERVLRLLRPDERQLVRLRAVEGQTWAEIAARLDPPITSAAARQRWRRLRERLRVLRQRGALDRAAIEALIPPWSVLHQTRNGDGRFVVKVHRMFPNTPQGRQAALVAREGIRWALLRAMWVLHGGGPLTKPPPALPS